MASGILMVVDEDVAVMMIPLLPVIVREPDRLLMLPPDPKLRSAVGAVVPIPIWPAYRVEK